MEEQLPSEADQTYSLELAETFAHVARVLVSEGSAQDTLDEIVQLAMQTIKGCDHAAISLVRHDGISTQAASDDVPRRVDEVQYEVGEGPCLEAIREHATYVTEDLSDEERWPNFSVRVAEETGIRSMLAYRLFVEADTLGALNLYSKTTAAFDDEAMAIGSVFAAHAAVALSSATQEENLQAALRTRDVIGQAKGILMERGHMTSDEAFALLSRASQRLNMKVRDVAEQVAFTGTTPGSVTPLPNDRPARTGPSEPTDAAATRS